MTPPVRSLAAVEPPPTAADGVFDTILADIMRGLYPPRSRLPAERELARLLGSSRPTIREALSRLAEWNLVEARRGSGVVVRDQREWNIEVLPAFLRYSATTVAPAAVARMVTDLLTLRRQLIVDCLRLVSDRVASTRLTPAREAVKRLNKRRVISSVRQGWVRFSPHFYTTRGELEALDRILSKCEL